MLIRKLEALFTIKADTAQFHRAASQLDSLAKKSQSIMGAIAGGMAVQTMHNIILETAKSMDELTKSASFLGLPSDALQEMQYAAQKSGVAIDTLDDSLKELQIRAVDSLSGSGEAFDAFNKLQVNPKDAMGRIREPLDLLDEVADKLNALPTQSERIWVVDSMFGDQGAMMLKMLKGGSAGLADMRAEARSLGLVFDLDSTKGAKKFNESLVRLHASAQILRQTLVVKIAPALTRFYDSLAAICGSINNIDVPLSVLRVSLISLTLILTKLAISAAVAFAPIILGAMVSMGPILSVGAAIIGLAVIVEDLWEAFSGGDSMLGRAWAGIKNFTDQVASVTSESLGQALASATKEYGKLDEYGSAITSATSKGFSESILSAKKGFGILFDREFQQNHMAPTPSYVSNHNRSTSNQNVNVSVNVKSQANPQEIGSEVSKVVRKELERERFNAFMGVSHYAG